LIDVPADRLSAAESYRLLVGIVVPRPIAWVTTRQADGRVNLAPFSCYTFVSSDPPMVAVSIGRRDGASKDTAENARRTGEFVVNIVAEDLVEPMHLSSAAHPSDASEPELLGIALAPSLRVETPRVAAAPVALECRLADILPFGRLQTELVVGEVVMFRIADALYRDGKVDTVAMRPLARLGGPHYARLGEILTMPIVGEPGPGAPAPSPGSPAPEKLDPGKLGP
jgi:flavin reductase (DIM6/NTAB) family NADH-FMN oxidoreductase RutF